MRSVRITVETEARLAAAAQRLGTSESHVIREALERYFQELESEDAWQRGLQLIQGWEAEDRAAGVDKLPLEDLSSNAGRKFADIAYAKWLASQGGAHATNSELRIAEERGAYDAGAPAD